MVQFMILAGSFTTFISAFLFVPGPRTGSPGTLSFRSQSFAGTSPSWIQQSPFNSSILYAVNEAPEGKTASFTIGAEGKLNLIDTILTRGNGPSNLLPLTKSREVAIMNYYGGNGLVAKLQSNLLNFVKNPAPPLITFNPAPALKSHPHQTVEVGNQLFVPDVGADKIWRLNKTSAGTWSITSFITHPTGSGPRHMVAQNGILYVLHEATSVLTSQIIPSNAVTSTPFISLLFTTPSDVDRNEFAAGEIQIPPTSLEFPNRFIYTSNRKIKGDNDPRGDSIAIFSLSPKGKFRLVKQVHTGLQNLRGFAIDPSGRYLVAGGNTSGGVKVFERISGGADLVQVAANSKVPTASSFVWV